MDNKELTEHAKIMQSLIGANDVAYLRLNLEIDQMTEDEALKAFIFYFAAKYVSFKEEVLKKHGKSCSNAQVAALFKAIANHMEKNND